MVGANVKQEIMTMMDRRTEIESELNTIIARLSVPNGAGLTGNLVDKDGFPRADIDIPAVRADRQRLSALRNDHREMTSKIEQNLHVLHSNSSFVRDSSSLPQKRAADGEGNFRPQRAFAPAFVGDAVVEMELDSGQDQQQQKPRVPFAVFDEISPGSPAAQDGLLLGDLLVKFGSVEGGDSLLQRLAMEGQRHQGSALEVVVLRQGVAVYLCLVPRLWHGRGLLGCHIRPL